VGAGGSDRSDRSRFSGGRPLHPLHRPGLLPGTQDEGRPSTHPRSDAQGLGGGEGNGPREGQVGKSRDLPQGRRRLGEAPQGRPRGPLKVRPMTPNVLLHKHTPVSPSSCAFFHAF